jgi:hypothetical protein
LKSIELSQAEGDPQSRPPERLVAAILLLAARLRLDLDNRAASNTRIPEARGFPFRANLTTMRCNGSRGQ